uniref:C2H2-type domain-containing protein n=2 Tax=Aegilops tauschii TaxID=37682 RepID=A0A453EH83_AEGTS
MHFILYSFYYKLLILLVAMDPNGSYPNILPLLVAMDPNGCYPNISPLHQALRGTTAMPILKDFVALESPPSDSPSIGNSSPTIHAPQEATVMSVNDRSMIPYQSHTHLAPLPPQLGDTIPNPLSLEKREMFSHEEFLTNPFWNDFDSSHQRQNLSMEDSFFTSLLQTEPKLIVHSRLTAMGEPDDGSIFKMDIKHVSEEQNIHDGRLLFDDSHGVPTPGSRSMQSSPIPREDKIPLVGPNGISDSGITHGPTTSRKYTCKIYSATFNSSQAYGGHMSSHSKARMKSLQS